MSTSTTSAVSTYRGDLLLAAALVATLLALDFGLRVADDRLSGNLAHVARIPDIMRTVGTSGDPAALLLLGNSLTNNGIDAQALAQAAPLATVAKVTPDGTSFWDWQCLLDRELLDHSQRRVPTVVMGTAWHLMSDVAPADASRLGALYCETSDLRKPSEIGIEGPGQIGEFLAARAFRFYALRDTLRNRALAAIIPDYKRFANRENAEHVAANEARDAPTTPERVAYTRFTALVSRLAAQGTKVVIVMMPVRHPYEIDVALSELAAAGQIRLIDYRAIEGIDAASFVDDMHLAPEGRGVLTARLARDLAQPGDSR